MTKNEKLTIAIEAIKKELHLLVKDGAIDEYGVEMLRGNTLLSALERRKGEPTKKKLSEITGEFLRTLCAGIRKHKNETAIFWRDWKVESGLVTRDAYGKVHSNTWVDIRLYNDMWEAFDRLKSVLVSLVNYFESVEKYNASYTDKSILLQIWQMDRERISYTLHRAEMELSLLKWDEPLEKERKEVDKS